MHENTFKTKLKSGEHLTGSFLNIPSSIIVEIMGRAGFDFFVVDGEHGVFNPKAWISASAPETCADSLRSSG